MAEQNPVSERIKILFDHFGDGNLSAFARLVGVNAQTIRDLMRGEKGGPSWPVLQNMLQAFPSIEMSWLLLGEGEMLKKSASAEISEEPQNNFSYKAPSAGENSVAAGVTQGGPATAHGMTVPTFGPPPRKPKAAPEPAGMDLVRTIAQQSADIQALKQAVEQLQRQAQEGAAK